MCVGIWKLSAWVGLQIGCGYCDKVVIRQEIEIWRFPLKEDSQGLGTVHGWAVLGVTSRSCWGGL